MKIHLTLESFINEAKGVEITPPNTPNTKTYFHGDDLDFKGEYINHKSGRYEYGAGLYLTTHYETAKKYAKGSRKLYMVTVELGNDLSESVLDINEIKEFVSSNIISSKRKEVMNRLEKYIKDGKVKAYLFNNIILNENAIKSSNTGTLRKFFVDNGIDYDLVQSPFGWGEEMMVLFNMDKIVSKVQIKRVILLQNLIYK